jgi:hypothetical protein
MSSNALRIQQVLSSPSAERFHHLVNGREALARRRLLQLPPHVLRVVASCRAWPVIWRQSAPGRESPAPPVSVGENVC